MQNPTDKQIAAVEQAYLRQARIHQWRIEDNLDDSEWRKRPRDIIDTIVVEATDSATYNASQWKKNDLSKHNTITPGIPLPGISCHIFINASGIIEYITDYGDMIPHTKGKSHRSISVMIQYSVKNNDAPPVKKIQESLTRILVLLCLEFKLNPHTAIMGHYENKWYNKLPLLKGRIKEMDASPGILVPLNNIRNEVAIDLKRKLRYAKAYDGQIDSTVTRDVLKALNKFNSDAIHHIYKGFTSVLYRKEDDE